MTISTITASTAASQASYANQVGSSNNSNMQVQRKPHGRPDGGGFIEAIASALKSIGVSSSDSATSSASASGTSTATTDSTSAADSSNAAQALGDFLQKLLSALHEQNGASSANDAPPPPPPQGFGGGGGKLESDLQSLISNLTASNDTSTNAASSTGTSSSLEHAFSTLLQALGGSSDTAGTKLAQFLQVLADNLPGASSSGYVINTSA